jgi:DNA polymerase I
MFYDAKLFETIQTVTRLNAWLKAVPAGRELAFDTETTGLNTETDTIVGASFSYMALAGDEIISCYVPIDHTKVALQGRKNIPVGAFMTVAKPFIETKKPVLHNVIFDAAICARYDLGLAHADDTMMMSYALTCMEDTRGHGMDFLAAKYLKHQTVKFTDVFKPSLGHVTFRDVPVDVATTYAAEDTAVTLMLYYVLRKALQQRDLWKVYTKVDAQMIPALIDMKFRGVRVDPAKLIAMLPRLEADIEEARDECHTIAGRKFNIASPKQLSAVLYDDLKLPDYTNSRSTAAPVLEGIEGEYPIVDAVIKFRKSSKLKGTYCDTLPTFINPGTGRVHPGTRQTSTRTARLSMADPSLHQIPVRTDQGKMIRDAFIADQGNLLACADYSQIEARILAHAANSSALIKAFEDGLDIHKANAANAFQVPFDKVTKQQRDASKTIVFAILYGLSDRSLAAKLGTDEDGAREFKERFFAAMPGVEDWMASVQQKASEDEGITTLFGRRISIPNTRSKRKGLYNAAMRQAVNYTIQGSAADLMRLAIGKVHSVLTVREKLILSVHDELIVECGERAAKRVAEALSEAMRSAGDHMIKWRVPIEADAGVGHTWLEAKEGLAEANRIRGLAHA